MDSRSNLKQLGHKRINGGFGDTMFLGFPQNSYDVDVSTSAGGLAPEFSPG